MFFVFLMFFVFFMLFMLFMSFGINIHHSMTTKTI